MLKIDLNAEQPDKVGLPGEPQNKLEVWLNRA